jgi:signal transduction histidine kinase
LSLGKIEEGKVQIHPTLFNLKDQLQLIINEIGPILKSGQQISYSHNGNNQATLDLSLLRNIMINLISSASKFSNEGAGIHVSSKIPKENISLLVRDEGLGIGDDDKKHLFERLFRGKNVINIQGTGLGLHIVSKYIKLMKGSVDVESELEKGTIFNIKCNL